MHEFLPEILKTASQIVAGNDPIQLTVKLHGRPVNYTKSPKPLQISISERYPKQEGKHPWQQYQPEDSWTRTLKEGSDELAEGISPFTLQEN